MSYGSLLRNIPEILSQPTGIAAIASLGIHGAIALIVPLMPVDNSKSKETESSKPVGIMELSPTDQSRLPQSPATSQVALQQPQLPLQQQLAQGNFGGRSTVLPPFNPALPSQINPTLSSQPGLPIIPPSSSSYTLSYLPKRQPLQKLSRENFRAEISDFETKSTFSPTTSSFVTPQETLIRETQPLNVNKLPQAQANNTIPGEPLKNPSPEPIDIGSSTTATGFSHPQKFQSADNAAKVPQNPLSSSSPEQFLADKGQLASALPSLPPESETSTNKPPELPTFKQSESPTKTTGQLVAQLHSYNTLRKAIQQEYPNAKEQAVIRETISTDKPGLEGTVLGRLVVDPDGKVLDIKFHDGSVSPELQSKAREFFSANPPKADQQSNTSYPFHLLFKNNGNNITGRSPEKKPSLTPNAEKVSEPQARKNQYPTSSVTTIQPSLTPIPSSNQRETTIKPSSTATPSSNPSGETTIKPSSTKPSSTPTISSNQPAVSTGSAQKLLQQLRQIREERENAQQK